MRRWPAQNTQATRPGTTPYATLRWKIQNTLWGAVGDSPVNGDFFPSPLAKIDDDPLSRAERIADASIRGCWMTVDLTQIPVVDDVVIGRLRTLRDQVARPGEDVLGELLSLFVNDTRVRIAAIRTAIADQNGETRRQAAHALKGSAGNVGARRVAELAAYVEKNAATPADVDRLEEEVVVAVAALEKRLA